MRRAYPMLAALLLLAGCAAPPSEEVAARGEASAPGSLDYAELEGEGADGVRSDTASSPYAERPGSAAEEDEQSPAARAAEHAEDGPDLSEGGGAVPLSADPHSARPGATEEQARPDPRASDRRAVVFVAPAAELQPVRAGRRPALPERAVLALTTVSEGHVVFDGEAVLALGDLLAREAALKSVVGLEPPALAEASLKDLVEAARASRRHLLLVDVRPQAASEKRTGFLFDTATGLLLARWVVEREGSGATPASSGSTSDLCDRLARSYARLTK